VADLDWHDRVCIDRRYFWPAEVDAQQANFSKARHSLDWQPSLKFGELVQLMVDDDLKAIKGALAGGWDAIRGTREGS
jgi:GDPmannose 4,6-dehydratase